MLMFTEIYDRIESDKYLLFKLYIVSNQSEMYEIFKCEDIPSENVKNKHFWKTFDIMQTEDNSNEEIISNVDQTIHKPNSLLWSETTIIIINLKVRIYIETE